MRVKVNVEELDERRYPTPYEQQLYAVQPAEVATVPPAYLDALEALEDLTWRYLAGAAVTQSEVIAKLHAIRMSR